METLQEESTERASSRSPNSKKSLNEKIQSKRKRLGRGGPVAGRTSEGGKSVKKTGGVDKGRVAIPGGVNQYGSRAGRFGDPKMGLRNNFKRRELDK